MDSSGNCVFRYSHILLLVFLICSSSSSSSTLHPLAVDTTAYHRNFTAISEFKVINRRFLEHCSSSNPYLQVNVTSSSSSSNSKTGLSDDEFVTVTVSGVSQPSDDDWVAMISPSDSDVKACLYKRYLYLQTGDTAELPLLCHYPVKAQYMKNDPNYLSCKKKECKKSQNGKCSVTTCSGSIKFHVINIRTDIEFVFFSGGFSNPCILSRSSPLRFANPNMPLHV